MSIRPRGRGNRYSDRRRRLHRRGRLCLRDGAHRRHHQRRGEAPVHASSERRGCWPGRRTSRGRRSSGVADALTARSRRVRRAAALNSGVNQEPGRDRSREVTLSRRWPGRRRRTRNGRPRPSAAVRERSCVAPCARSPMAVVDAGDLDDPEIVPRRRCAVRRVTPTAAARGGGGDDARALLTGGRGAKSRVQVGMATARSPVSTARARGGRGAASDPAFKIRAKLFRSESSNAEQVLEGVEGARQNDVAFRRTSAEERGDATAGEDEADLRISARRPARKRPTPQAEQRLRPLVVLVVQPLVGDPDTPDRFRDGTGTSEGRRVIEEVEDGRSDSATASPRAAVRWTGP